MIHNIAELLWTPFVNTLKYGGVAYIVTKGLLATLADLCDFVILLLSHPSA